jgi:predicted nucleotidyltransferase
MSQHEWADYPQDVRSQIENLLNALEKLLRDHLAGVYLHGSLALGCFNPEQSDIDLLAVTSNGMTVETKRQLAELLLRLSSAPAPIEISFLQQKHISPWQYPTPFDFHYSEDWREKFAKELSSGEWKKWNEAPQKDKDLAAHITVTRRRGIALCGKPVEEVFPAVPEQDYIDSIVEDFNWAAERMDQYPTYFILNSCRVYVYLLEDRICSKEEAGTWALNQLPEDLREYVAQALDIYRGNREDKTFAETILKRYANHMAELISNLMVQRNINLSLSPLSGTQPCRKPNA